MGLKVSYYFKLFPGTDGEPAVAFHSRTGGTYAFTPDALARLQCFVSAPDYTEDAEFRDFMLREEILISSDINELELIKHQYRNDRHSNEELYVTYSMTNACNFRCTYCYQEHKTEVLENENLEKTFRYIEREIPKYKRLKIHWFGGEPTLRLKWIRSSSERLTKLCDDLGKEYFAGITTNGSTFTDDVASELKSCRIRQVQFTLDGDREIHDLFRITKSGKGTFDTVLKAIQISAKHGFLTFVRVNLSPCNQPRLRMLLDRLRDSGLGPHNIILYLNEMKEHTNSTKSQSMYFASIEKYGDSLIESLRILKEYGYPVPKLGPVDVNCAFDKPSSVLFGVDGNLYHCTTGTDKALAMLGSDGIVAQETARKSFIHRREPWDDPTCKSCTNLPTCMGGCAYLDEEGKVKCNPEGFVIEKLVRLSI